MATKPKRKPTEPAPLTLTPDSRNPNRLTDADKGGLARALAEFGDLSGIIVNRRTGLLVGGHQRASVMQDGKLTVADLPGPDPTGTVAIGYLEHLGRRYAVRVVDWDEHRAKAAMIAANRWGRIGMDEASILKDVLQELDDANQDMGVIGYTPEALEQLMVETKTGGAVIAALELFPYEHYDYVLVLADKVQDWEWLVEFCGLEKLDARNAKSGAKIGLGRAVRASRIIEKIQEATNEARRSDRDSKSPKE